MKSGKSFDLISHFAPLQYTDVSYILYQSTRNVRDEKISSRNGVGLEAKKVESLGCAFDTNYSVVGIDEVHMFSPEDVAVIAKLLKKGVKVTAAGLDMDYQGKIFEVVKSLLELGPKEVRYKRAVCEVCRLPEAVYTQVFDDGKPIVADMPSVIPEDGRYAYLPVCRTCFIRA